MNRLVVASLRILFLGFVFSLIASCSYRKKISAGQVSISPFFSSNMIFQKGEPIKLYGKSSPNGVLAIKIESALKYTTANEAGEWEVSFPPVDYKGEFSITIEGLDKTIELKNLAMGKVWLVIGDAWQDDAYENYSVQVFSGVQDKKVRYFQPKTGFAKTEKLEGEWKIAKREKILQNEYLCHLLGEELSKKGEDYVGIINLTYPGLKASDVFNDSPEGVDTLWNNHLMLQKERKRIADSSFRGLEHGVLERRLDDWDWNEITFPVIAHKRWFLENRTTWLRKKVYISQKYIDSDFMLEFGTIRGQFDFYFNGTKIKSFMGEESDFSIEIPDSLVRVWTNLITIRMSANDSLTGFYSPTPKIANIKSTFQRELTDEWLYRSYLEQRLPNVSSADSIVFPLRHNVLDRFETLHVEGMLLTGGFNFFYSKSDVTKKTKEALRVLDDRIVSSNKYMFLVPKPGIVDSIVNYGLYNNIRNAQLESGAGFGYKLINTMDIHPGNDMEAFYVSIIERFRKYE